MIDNKTIEQARNIDMIAFFGKRYGFSFTHKSGMFRCNQHKSLAVKNDCKSWYWHSKGIGGFGVIDYLTKVENMPFRQAVEVATGTTQATAPQLSQQQEDKPKNLVLPEQTGIPLRLYDYLCKKRGIDGEIVSTLINKDKLYEDIRGNVVFVGYDEAHKPRFASLRGTRADFRGDCAGSDKRYGFSISGFSKRLYIFESPIDLMSHASIEKAQTGAWANDSRLSLAGTTDTAMPFFLNQHRAVKELVFCLDNDNAGREASYALAKKYVDKGYSVQIIPPVKKDFNDDLQVVNDIVAPINKANVYTKMLRFDSF